MINSQGINLVRSRYLEMDHLQIDKVRDTLSANYTQWMTLQQISQLSGIESLSSIASRIRDLRIEGDYIERRAHPNAGGKTRIFEYRMV